MKRRTNSSNFVEIAMAFTFRNLVKFQYIFSFWVLYPYRCTDGVKFDREESVPNFTSIGATCLPAGRKTSKSRVTYIPALCAACNAAGWPVGV